jgi:isochorismate synthase
MNDEPPPLVHASSLPPAFDLLAACADERPDAFRFLFERDGLGVAATTLEGGWGHSVEPVSPTSIAGMGRHMEQLMRGFSTGGAEVPGAPAPVAIGQIGFGPGGDAWMRVPPQLVRRTEPGETWLLELLPHGEEAEPFEPRRPTGGAGPAAPFAPAQIEPRPTAEAYAGAVRTAVERIRGGDLRKVVLARTMHVTADRTLDPVRLAHRLRAVDRHAYTFIVAEHAGVRVAGRPVEPLLVGASPELLVSRRGRTVRSTPLAGSAPRAGDPDEDRANADALFDSAKDREEHAIVVEAIDETLRPRCDRLDHDPEPVLLETANVWHLATRFDGVLRDPAPSAVDLVAELHPTPAVCGSPTELARALIGELEPFDRGGYAGPVGWMDAHGDGEWAIALRCALLTDRTATLLAGAGIVAGSDPVSEVDETDRKFRAFLDSLRWG